MSSTGTTAAWDLLPTCSTQNYIPMFTDTSCGVADSVMYQGGGSVGIGTTTPGGLLDISAANIWPLILRNTDSLNGYGGSVELVNSGASGRTYALMSTSNENSVVSGGTFSIYDVTGDVYRLVVNSSGNVGIGTTAPAQKLDVATGSVRSAFKTLTFSATPTFDASLGNTQKITLTGNVTSSTLANATAGEAINFIICQDSAGGRTFIWPAVTPGPGVLNPPLVNVAPNACTYLSTVFDGTNAVPTNRDSKVVDATTQPGADVCAQIASAAASLPPTGGTVDARGFQGTQTCGTNPLATQQPGIQYLLGNTVYQTTVPWVVSADHTSVVGTAPFGDGLAGGGTTIQAAATISSYLFDNSNPNASAACAAGTNIGCAGTLLQNVFLDGDNNATSGLRITGPPNALISDGLFERIRIYHLKGGIGLYTGGSINQVVFREIDIQPLSVGSISVCLDLGQAALPDFFDMTLAGCTTAGVQLEFSAGGRFYGGVFSGNLRDVLVTDHDFGLVAFHGTYFENSTQGIVGNTSGHSHVGTLDFYNCYLQAINFIIAASPNGATESGNTVTITTTTTHSFKAGQTVVISGVGVAGYNGTYTVLSSPPPTAMTFAYTDPTSGLAASGGGTAAPPWMDFTNITGWADIEGGTQSGATDLNAISSGLSLRIAGLANMNYLSGLPGVTPAGQTGANANTLQYLVHNGVMPVVARKTGSQGGNYSTSSTTLRDVDATNLAYTTVIPVGWKLQVVASFACYQSTAPACMQFQIYDTVGTGVLQPGAAYICPSAASQTLSGTTQAVIPGDGASHTVKLQWATTNASDASNLQNSSAAYTPVMSFTLTLSP